MTLGIIIQARMGSTRLPVKVLGQFKEDGASPRGDVEDSAGRADLGKLDQSSREMAKQRRPNGVVGWRRSRERIDRPASRSAHVQQSLRAARGVNGCANRRFFAP